MTYSSFCRGSLASSSILGIINDNHLTTDEFNTLSSAFYIGEYLFPSLDPYSPIHACISVTLHEGSTFCCDLLFFYLDGIRRTLSDLFCTVGMFPEYYNFIRFVRSSQISRLYLVSPTRILITCANRHFVHPAQVILYSNGRKIGRYKGCLWASG